MPVIDSLFTGGSGRRIYGPKDCAKAARVEELDINAFNADSYAEFMLGMYWKDLFQGHLFKPESDRDLLESPRDIDPKTPDFELVSDNDANYIDFGAQATQPQLTCAGEPKDKPSTTQDWVAAQIDDYCNQITSQGWIVNSTLGRYGPKGYTAGKVAPDSDNDLWLSVSHDLDCDANTGYEVELGPCREYLNMALNGCNTESTDKKWGGEMQANCALWNITTRAGHDSTPPNGIPPTPQDFRNG